MDIMGNKVYYKSYFKSEELPYKFDFESKTYEIKEIIRTKHILDIQTKKEYVEFIVKCGNLSFSIENHKEKDSIRKLDEKHKESKTQ